jgi:hypothetical protein
VGGVRWCVGGGKWCMGGGKWCMGGGRWCMGKCISFKCNMLADGKYACIWVVCLPIWNAKLTYIQIIVPIFK